MRSLANNSSMQSSLLLIVGSEQGGWERCQCAMHGVDAHAKESSSQQASAHLCFGVVKHCKESFLVGVGAEIAQELLWSVSLPVVLLV